MNYQRILVLTELGVDARGTFAAIRRFLPSAEQLLVVAEQPTRQLAWLTPAAPADLNLAASRALEELREAADLAGPAVDVELGPELTGEGLAEAAADSQIELVVAGSLPVRTLSVIGELRKRSSLPVLYARRSAEATHDEGLNRLLCVALDRRGRSAVSAFLRDHASPGDRALLFSSRPLSSADLRAFREVAGIKPDVRIDPSPGGLRQLIVSAAGEKIDLVVLPRFPPPFLLALASGPPVLVLPPVHPAAPERERTIDLPDLVDDGSLIRARIEYGVGLGRRTPVADQEVAFVREGKIVARAISRRGQVHLPPAIGDSLGVFRTQGKDPPHPLPVEGSVAVLRAGPRALVLFDAEIDPRELKLLREVSWAEPLAVRMRSMQSCASLRARLRAALLPPRVIDASAVLGEGEALDVPSQADAVRLARVASRMLADGFRIAAIVYRGPHKPVTSAFAAVRPLELPELSAPDRVLTARGRASLAERLNATTGSARIEGNQIEVELDNPKARGWLLSSIEGSRRRVHFQVYMGLNDDVGRSVEAALAAAGARGVTVRVLVDSLHGLHGSLGQRNPLFERLSSRPGVELHVSRPIPGLPSLEDLKQRDHRKLVVVDGEVGLLGGRNLSHEYYTGFQEVVLTPDVTWRTVPWLDAGARVEGPAVAALERSFLEAWTDAGGHPFDIVDPGPAGATAARVVVHRGLRDAYALEAYLALIETARSHIYAVNGFPLQLEIQHALLRALERGVRVRTLFGNLTPRYGDEPFKGPLASARLAATSFVHSRMDELVAAGGECYEFVVRNQPGGNHKVFDLRPHVHAKAMSADGQVCAVGSANLDVTAGYWESELLLVVEDAGIARAVEARFDELIAGSDRVDPGDPEWRRRAELRKWMRHWPGVLG
jgi:phosphatidylserine/phosphatidylglycerophosphate/cardiolipin synthase-like enzyme